MLHIFGVMTTDILTFKVLYFKFPYPVWSGGTVTNLQPGWPFRVFFCVLPMTVWALYGCSHMQVNW